MANRLPTTGRPATGTLGLALPGLLWLGLFAFAPLALVAVAGFLSRGELGDLEWRFTLENFRRLAGWGELGFDPLYPRIFGRTLLLGAAVTLACLLTGLPLAFAMARLRPRGRALVLLLVMVPFWTNLLIRTYAWQILLGAGGPLSSLAAALGLVAPGTALYPGWGAVFLATWLDFLPFMVLPLYASVEKIDWHLAEAAADLGASPIRAFWHAVLPQIRPGMATGALLVFLPCLGQFVIPELLGGGQVTLLGSLIQQQFGMSRDWPLGSAAATVALVTLLAAVTLLRWRRSPAVEDSR